jgi:ABC-type oligopeptide transport system substrate-binding subunit
MAQNWEEVLGISVDVDVLDFPQFLELGSQAGYSLVFNGYMPDLLDPEDIFRMQEKAIGFKSPEFKKALEKARRETNQARRIALYQEADRIFIEAAAAIPVTYNSPDMMIKPWARGYTDSVESLKYLTVGERESKVSIE